jgi:hypothetical protein
MKKEYDIKTRKAMALKTILLILEVHIAHSIKENDILLSDAIYRARNDINSFLMAHKISKDLMNEIEDLKKHMNWLNGEEFMYIPFIMHLIVLAQNYTSFNPFRGKTMRLLNLKRMRLDAEVSKHIEETKSGNAKAEVNKAIQLAQKVFDKHLEYFELKF